MSVFDIKKNKFSQNLYQKKGLLLIVALILVFILSPISASAQISEAIAQWMINGVLNFVRGAMGSLIALVGSWVDSVFSIPTTDVPVVKTSWEIVRNFANMFFVVILVIGAFATIFDVAQYDFRTMFGRFIVAALLINFSLVIGQIIIDWSQSLSNVFLQAIGNVGSRIAQGAAIGERFSEGDLLASVAPTDTSAWLASIAVFANIILLSIILFSLVVLLFFTLVRVPILWALLIVSPIAWVAYVLPSTKKFNQDWWKFFLGWNMFLPIYLFFIYFGVLFLNNKEALKIVTSGTVVPGVSATLETIFFYTMIGIFLIGGAKVAMSSSIAAGAGGVAAGIWARGRTAARFTGGIVARPVTSRYEAISGAAQERIAQAKREGVLGFGGTEAQERRQAAYAESFGVRDAKEKQLAKDVGTSKERLKTITDPKRLEELSTQGKNYERLAALERLAEMQDLNAEQVSSAFKTYGGPASLNARKFIDRVDPKKYTKQERDLLYSQIDDVKFKQKIADARAERGDFADIKDFIEQSTIFTSEADKAAFAHKAKDYIERLKAADRQAIYASVTGEMKRELALILAEKGDFGADITDPVTKEIKITAIDRIKEAANLFEAPNQREDLINKAKQKNVVAAIQAKRDLGLLSEDKSYETTLEEEVGKLSNKAILELSTQSLKNEEFQKALIKSLSRGTQQTKRISGLLSNIEATAEKIEALGPAIDEIRKKAPVTRKTPSQGGPRERVEQPEKPRIILSPGAQFDIEKEEKK